MMMSSSTNINTHSFNKISSPSNQIKLLINNNAQHKKEKFKKDNILKVATINANHITTYKQQMIIEIMKKKNIDILGLSETWIQHDQSKYLFNNYKDQYFPIFHNTDTNYIGKGIGFLIKKSLSFYIRQIRYNLGRIAYVDFEFRKKSKLRVIQFYGISAQNNMSLDEYHSKIKESHDEILSAIKEAKTNQSQVIIMGDFNLNFEKYTERKLKGLQLKLEHRLFHQFENKLNLFDPIPMVYDIKSTNPIYTFTPHVQGHNPSRIDFIWVSEDIISQFIDTLLIKVDDIIKTDHKLLTISFYTDIIFNIPKIVIPKRLNNIKQTVYEYGKMTSDDWDNYKTQQETILSKTELVDLDIDDKWLTLQKCMTQTSNIIPSYKKSGKKSCDHPIKSSKEFSNCKYIATIRRKLKHKKSRDLIIEKWKTHRGYLTSLNNDQFRSEWNTIPNDLNYSQLINDLTILYNIWRDKFNIFANAIKLEMIQEAIEHRCQDLKDNQKRMINSIMNRELKTIVIDHLLISQKPDEQVLVTDPTIIMQETNKHFQTIANSINSYKEIPTSWKAQYQPIDNIDENIYENLLAQVTKEELLGVIRDKPNGKAVGPSGISYEMYKNSSPKVIDQLLMIISDIFEHHRIPKEWKRANVYPIPKPKAWGYQLNNTRPITLLDTARKITVSIMNSRLAKIMAANKVLQGYQFAGLPFCSTFEPLRIINEIIQDANEHDRNLWLLALDMSKAYDRVNIYMLERALKRIKIPKGFIEIIVDLFTERTNQVFTYHGITEPYEVLTGIDQGEIISPLLWCIYYDPLLSEIKKRKMGYKLKANQVLNIYENITRTHKVFFPGLAYMDDTNFISDNKTDLENILKLANEFYDLNSIQINKEKSELLLHLKTKKFNYDERIDIKFGVDIMRIKPIPKHEAMRILGVWFNPVDNKQYVKKQLHQKIQNIANNVIYKKRITDKQMAYIFNMLIVPKIEYRSQTIVFKETELSAIMSPFRRVMKRKLKFAMTAPNIILESNRLYNVRSLVDNQTQAKITNFLNQINDKGILGDITQLRLIQLQNDMWLQSSPLTYITDIVKKNIFKYKKLSNNFLLSNIELMHRYNITIEFDSSSIRKTNIIPSKSKHILEIIEFKEFIKHLQILKKHKLMFLDQFTTLSGSHMLSWWQLQQRKYVQKNKKGHCSITPSIYNIVKKQITYNNSFAVKTEYRILHPIINLRGYEVMNVYDPDLHQNTFMVFWKTELQGATIWHSIYDSNQVIIRHYTITPESFTANSIIRPCTGCELATDSTTNKSKKMCLIMLETNKLFIIAKPSYSKLIDPILQARRLYNVQYEDLFDIFRNYSTLRDNPNMMGVYDYRLIGNNVSPIQNKCEIIISYIDHSLNRNELIKSFQQLERSNLKNFLCYTDGSVKKIDNIYQNMTFGTSIYDIQQNHLLDFVSSSDYNVNSIKAETWAILVTVLIVPYDSFIVIYTDSDAVFNNYHQLPKEERLLRCRQIFKLDHCGMLWANILEIMNKKNILMQIEKVKGHSGISGNERIDLLIKEGHEKSEDLGLSLKKQPLECIRYSPYWNKIPIEQNIRKFIKLMNNMLNIEKFLNLNRNEKYRITDVDIELTFNLIDSHSEGSMITNFKDQKLKRRKIQLLIEELPHLEQVKKSLYAIYKHRKCPFCSIEDESFNHVWLCSRRRSEIVEIRDAYITDLICLLNEELTTPYKVQASDLMLLGSIWTIGKSDVTLTFIDIIKGFIPLTLSQFFNLRLSKSRSSIIMYETRVNLLNNLWKYWEKRCDLLNEIDIKLGITKKIKREKLNIEFNPNIYRYSSQIEKYDNLEGLRAKLTRGLNNLNFTVKSMLNTIVQ
jgi:exonuclease III